MILNKEKSILFGITSFDVVFNTKTIHATTDHTFYMLHDLMGHFVKSSWQIAKLESPFFLINFDFFYLLLPQRKIF